MPGFEIFGDEERKEVQDVLDTGVLSRYGFDGVRKGHWKARTFESELANRIGSEYSHLCSSGTAALGIALAACGIGAGDEVIVPPFTFIATIGLAQLRKLDFILEKQRVHKKTENQRFLYGVSGG